ncbi:MAG: hypothetical protein OEY09_06590 [Gammaproteobacteria bacterium]|nr:hypothetical protein [Gammaproteobacteria bacterium]
MDEKQVAYIAGMGMVTPVGANVGMTAAAVRAGISGYAVSDFYGQNDEPVTMSLVPDEFFASVDMEIDEGDYYGAQHERVIKMAVTAIRESLPQVELIRPVPLVLAFPEPLPNAEHSFPESLKANLLAQKNLPFQKEYLHSIFTGRSGGIEAVDIAMRYLYEQSHDYVLLGGSDSYFQCPRLNELDQSARLLSLSNSDGFVPGEGAGFILLTRNKKLAIEMNQHVICVYEPGVGNESGHLYSDLPYKGEGLDIAVKKALLGFEGVPVNHIFSSMNGEKFCSKEYGVAMLRNKQAFHEKVSLEHPVDCFGDIGVALGPVMMALSATIHNTNPASTTSLVYCSSDGAARAAILMQRIPVDTDQLRSQS